MSYDGLSRLVTQTASGTTTAFYYSAQDQVLEEAVGGKYTARYAWSPVYVNALVFRDTDTSGSGLTGTGYQRLWVQQDANWNVTALVNGSGVVVERYVYTPYGVLTVLNASWTTLSGSAYNWVYGFQGMRYDLSSQLDFSQSRPYSAALGRWTRLDPLGYGAGDDDLYRAFANDPTRYTDPSGELLPLLLVGAVIIGGVLVTPAGLPPGAQAENAVMLGTAAAAPVAVPAVARLTWANRVPARRIACLTGDLSWMASVPVLGGCLRVRLVSPFPL